LAKDKSTILVFQDGAATPVAELAPGPDIYKQPAVGGFLRRTRSISVMGPQSLQAFYGEIGGIELPSLDHNGIGDSLINKGSTWYWHQGEWLLFVLE